MKTHLVSFGNYLLIRYNVKVHSTDGANTPLYDRQVTDADLSNWEAENPDLEGGVPFKAHTDYPSRYEIGERVTLYLMPEGEESFPGISAKIIAVHFTNSKVKYDLELRFAGEYTTRIYNVDSILVGDLNLPVINEGTALKAPERILDAPVRYTLSECLRELKWGRPGPGQALLDKWIAEVDSLYPPHEEK